MIIFEARPLVRMTAFCVFGDSCCICPFLRNTSNGAVFTLRPSGRDEHLRQGVPHSHVSLQEPLVANQGERNSVRCHVNSISYVRQGICTV